MDTTSTTDTPNSTGLAATPLGHRLTVNDGLIGVNRVTSLLRQRGYSVLIISAWNTQKPGIWYVDYVVVATKHQSEMLIKQLNRLTCVLKIEHRKPFSYYPRATDLSATKTSRNAKRP